MGKKIGKIILIIFLIIVGVVLYRQLERRNTFYNNNRIKNLKVFCIEKDALAIETYCRLLRCGAIPINNKEKADLIVHIDDNILYISSSTRANYLNLPIGEKYIKDTQKKYLHYFDLTLDELSKIQAPNTKKISK